MKKKANKKLIGLFYYEILIKLIFIYFYYRYRGISDKVDSKAMKKLDVN